jgi:putative hydrolase of the HAD superfamily
VEASLVPEIKALFFDVGGVLLSNAWDRTQRIRALQQFHLDEVEFHDRHEMVVSSLERGKITLDDYLDRTVFYRTREFTREAFKDFMLSLSHPDEAALRLARSLAASGKYLLSTINNESKELNAYRIRKFGLHDIFSLFVSSCYVGLRKPEPGIYQLALDITDRKAEECVFIDDRALNLDAAQRLGMHTIEMKDAAQLGKALQDLGVNW